MMMGLAFYEDMFRFVCYGFGIDLEYIFGYINIWFKFTYSILLNANFVQYYQTENKNT